jgi:hypothetical protein
MEDDFDDFENECEKLLSQVQQESGNDGLAELASNGDALLGAEKRPVGNASNTDFDTDGEDDAKKPQPPAPGLDASAKTPPLYNSWDDVDLPAMEEAPSPERAIVFVQSTSGEPPVPKANLFSAATQAPPGSTILLHAGTHHWPGGDLRVSIVGDSAEDVILEGNEGGGYFFYFRCDGLRVQNVTLRGTMPARSHFYVDDRADITVQDCVVDVQPQAPYEHSVYILNSHRITISGNQIASCGDAVFAHSGSTEVDVVGNTIRDCKRRAVYFVKASGVIRGNCMSGNQFPSDIS